MLRRIVGRLPAPLQRALFRGGQRSDRLRDPDSVVAALRIQQGDRVADLGPGYGHFTLRLALAVGPDGICYAADADEETLHDLRRAADDRGVTYLHPALTSRRRLELPEPVDLLFVSLRTTTCEGRCVTSRRPARCCGRVVAWPFSSHAWRAWLRAG